MITIKTHNMEVAQSVKGLKAANFASDSVYIKFADDVEITIPCSGDPARMNQILTMLRNTKCENSLLDLTSRDTPISFT